MVALEKITPEMFPDIYDAFLAKDDKRLTRDNWRMIFTPNPQTREDYSGYVLLEGDNPVGVLGTHFSERMIDGKSIPFCNLHTWKVDLAHRGYSLFMMRPVLALKEHTITDFTPTEDVCKISQKLGFKSLDSTLKILLPFNAGVRDQLDVELVDNIVEIENRVNEIDRKLCNAHRHPDCGHLLACHGKDYCYVIYSKVAHRLMSYCYLHYISDRQKFARWHSPIRTALLNLSNTRYCAIDARQTTGIHVPFSFNCPVKTKQLFKSQSVRSEQIDSLYSEIFFLNISTHPAVRYLARRLTRKLRLSS